MVQGVGTTTYTDSGRFTFMIGSDGMISGSGSGDVSFYGQYDVGCYAKGETGYTFQVMGTYAPFLGNASLSLVVPSLPYLIPATSTCNDQHVPEATQVNNIAPLISEINIKLTVGTSQSYDSSSSGEALTWTVTITGA